MLVPTRRLIWLLGLGVPLVAVAYEANLAWVGLAYNLALLATAVMTALVTPDKKSIRITRRFDAVLSVRVPNSIVLTIENTGDDPIHFRFRDEPPPSFIGPTPEFDFMLRAHATTERTYHVAPLYRGTDFFRDGFVRIQCPFGLVVKQQKLVLSEVVRVYPNVLALKEFSLLNQRGRLRELGIRRTRIRGLGSEFESLREYAEGDDFRRLDWNATARRGKLIVRQDEAERNQAVILCIDAGRRMLGEVDGVTKLDYALDACLMLAQAAISAGDQVGLLVYSDRLIRYIPPKRGKLHLGALIEAMHDVTVLPVASDVNMAFSYLASRWKKRSLLALFTDVGESNAARELLTAVIPLARRHYIFRAQIDDPHFQEVISRPLADTKTMYQRAAGLILQEEKSKARALLKTAGMVTIESEPQDLAASLISHYYEVKERALL